MNYHRVLLVVLFSFIHLLIYAEKSPVNKSLYHLIDDSVVHIVTELDSERLSKVHYNLVDDPIDVVIVTHPKDKETLDDCINGIRENCHKVGRIIVVSPLKLTDQAEWFDEKKYPFTVDDMIVAIGKGDKKKGEKYFQYHWRPPGWYLQQLLKLYAPFVIPNISSNVLVVDADTIFMNPVEFLNDSFGGLFCDSHLIAKKRYLNFAERFIPGMKRIYPHSYGVCHHMLFQRSILEDLFNLVEKHFHTTFWEAFCLNISLDKDKGASEYQMYYTFAFNRTHQVDIRPLKWTNSAKLEQRNSFKKRGYHFVSFHDYLRN